MMYPMMRIVMSESVVGDVEDETCPHKCEHDCSYYGEYVCCYCFIPAHATTIMMKVVMIWMMTMCLVFMATPVVAIKKVTHP